MTSSPLFLLFLFLVIPTLVFSLHITIDGDNGYNHPSCLLPIVSGERQSCKSLEYVSKRLSTSITSNLTIEIISSGLIIKKKVYFSNFDVFTLNGKDTTVISCDGKGVGISICSCTFVNLSNLTITKCGLCGVTEDRVQNTKTVHHHHHHVDNECLRESLGFALTVFEPQTMLTVKNCNFVNNTVTGTRHSHCISYEDIYFAKNYDCPDHYKRRQTNKDRHCKKGHRSKGHQSSETHYGGLKIFADKTSFLNLLIEECQFKENSHDQYGDSQGNGLHLFLNKVDNSSVNILNSDFKNNKPGLSMSVLNSTSTSINVRYCNFTFIPTTNTSRSGMRLTVSHASEYNEIDIHDCHFKRNRYSLAAGLNIAFMGCDTKRNNLYVSGCTFIDNTAFKGGGGVNVEFAPIGYNAYPIENNITFEYCQFINNSALFAAGLGLLTASVEIEEARLKQANLLKFISCNFTGNKAYSGAAVHINKDIPREAGSYFITDTNFHNCRFTNNGVPNSTFKDPRDNNTSNAVLSGIFFANEVWVYFYDYNIFENNTATALQVSSSVAAFRDGSRTDFINNSGLKGGAILLTGNAMIQLDEQSVLNFENNHAILYGGAIAAVYQRVRNLGHASHCFMQSTIDNCESNKPQLYFTNNTCQSGYANDIFVPSWEPCYEACRAQSKNLSRSDKKDPHHHVIFTDKCYGSFNFANSHKSLGSAATKLNLSVKMLCPIPGVPLHLPITLTDEFGNYSGDIFPITVSIKPTTREVNLKTTANEVDYNNIIVYPNTFTNDTDITFKGYPGAKRTLFIQTTVMTTIIISVEVQLGECPPGYVINDKNKKNIYCMCSTWSSTRYYGLRYCDSYDYSAITVGYWAGYFSENKSDTIANEDTFTTAQCSIELCNFHGADHKLGIYHLPTNTHKDNFSQVVCNENRKGVLCSKCIKGYSAAYHSPSFSCSNSTCHNGILYYILSELLPITVIFVIIIVFNIYLTSGTLYTVIFYAQIIDNIFPNAFQVIKFDNQIGLIMTILRGIYGLADFNILYVDKLSFCIYKDASIMGLFMVKYITTIYALGLVIFTILILKVNSLYTCAKLGRKCGRRNIRGSVINGLTAFIVLCYCQSVYITFEVLLPSQLYGKGGKEIKKVLLFDGEMGYLSREHLQFAIPAFLILFIIIIPPPILLLFEPLLVKVSGVVNMRRNRLTYTLQRIRMKLKPFLDSFQGCFKDNCRAFAGLFFIYRILLLVSITYSSDIAICYLNIMFVLFIILLLHCFMRPFQNKWHNRFDQFLIANLLFVNGLTISNYFLTVWKAQNTIYTTIPILQAILISSPIVIGVTVPLVNYLADKKKVRERFVLPVSEAVGGTRASEFDDLSWPARLLTDNNEQSFLMTTSYNTFNTNNNNNK